jgi:hypothetical protein
MVQAGSSGRVAFTARVPEDLHRRMRIWCAQQDMDLQDFVTEAVRAYLTADRSGHPSSCPLAGAKDDEVRACRDLLTILRGADPHWREFVSWFLTSVRRRVGAQ